MKWEDFVRRVIRRVVVGNDKIIVEAGKRELWGALIDSQLMPAATKKRGLSDEHSDDLVRLDVATRLTRYGCEMRLLVAPDVAVLVYQFI